MGTPRTKQLGQTGATSGQTLTWDGSDWSPTDFAASGLADTPSSYSGAAERVVGVNTAEDGLEYKANSYLRDEGTFVVHNTLQSVFIGEGDPGNFGTVTGIDNVVIGHDAGDALTSGFVNVLIGTNAGGAINTGAANIAIGKDALSTIQSANSNTCIGGSSLASATGNQNVVVGNSTFFFLGGGNDNTAVGYQIGSTLTSGSRNVLIGKNMDVPAASTDDLIAIGSQGTGNAGQLMVVDSAIEGVFIGGGQPGQWPTVTGVHNVCVGDRAGVGLQAGARNTFLGADTGTVITSGTDNILVGFNVGAPATSTSNHISIGDVIFGNASTLDARIGGSGVVSQTERLAVVGADADTLEVFSVEQTGTNGAKSRFYVGTQDPSGTITANPGSVYLRVSGVNSGIYYNNGASSGTTWTQA